ncbi:MAG: hypothetical protein AAGF13_06825, partial [Pseudomonadota bacterium]
MSFLPYSGADSGVWWGSIGLSTATHIGFGVLIVTTGSLILAPLPAELDSTEDQFSVSLEILDAEIIEEVQPPIDDRIPEDAEELLPETEELAALEAQDLLEPEPAALEPEEDLLAPVEEDLAPEPVPELEPLDTIEPEIAEPEPAEPAALDPVATEPEVLEPTDTEPEEVEVAEVVPEVLETEATEEEEQPLFIPDEFAAEITEETEIAQEQELQIIDPEAST